MLKLTSISPRDLGESLRRRRRSAFIYHTFIHTHNLLHYYKVGDQASVEVEGVKEQMLIFSSSLTPGRVKGSWIVLIWKIPACLKFGKTSILWPCCSAQCTLSARNLMLPNFGERVLLWNDRCSRLQVRTRLITKCVYYEWASDSFAYPCPCNNSWYAHTYPQVKKETRSPFISSHLCSMRKSSLHCDITIISLL